MTAYLTKIITTLSKLGTVNGTVNPDSKHNTGAFLGTAYMWDEVERYAKQQSEKAWKAMEENGLAKAEDKPGKYTLEQSPHFTLTLAVSEPVRRFDADTLANALSHSKYHVPTHVTKELVEKAKVPGNVKRTYKIIETV